MATLLARIPHPATRNPYPATRNSLLADGTAERDGYFVGPKVLVFA